jgi:transposase
MLHFDPASHSFVGSAGTLPVADHDLLTHRLAMLLEGECELGPKAAADKFGLSRQRYFQLRQQFSQHGAAGLAPQQRGPKHNYRRTDTIVRQVIRHRFLDPDASAEVITQKLVQTGVALSIRSVERIIHDYGLQKKIVSQARAAASHPDATNHPTHPARTG